MNDKDDCGSCDYQGDFITPQGVECRIDHKVHERGYRCEDFKISVPGKHLSVRQEQALEKRKVRAAKASEERNTEFAEKVAQQEREYAAEIARINREYDAKLQEDRMKFERKWSLIQIVLGAVLGAVLGIAGTLVVQALSKH